MIVVEKEVPEVFDFSSLSVEEKIEYKALEYDLDPELMVAIAKAESYSHGEFHNIWNWRHDERPNYYTAFGIFMIVRTTYLGFCGDPEERFDIDKNIECAMIIASTSGTHHWSESAHVWYN